MQPAGRNVRQVEKEVGKGREVANTVRAKLFEMDGGELVRSSRIAQGLDGQCRTGRVENLEGSVQGVTCVEMSNGSTSGGALCVGDDASEKFIEDCSNAGDAGEDFILKYKKLVEGIMDAFAGKRSND